VSRQKSNQNTIGESVGEAHTRVHQWNAQHLVTSRWGISNTIIGAGNRKPDWRAGGEEDQGIAPRPSERSEVMNEITHRFVEANGIRIHVAEQGEGPLVVLCHGFPESWYSWRHQLWALAGAGFHAVAPDMRGYGQTDRPDEIDKYTIFHLVGDMVGLLDALGAESAVIAGHDWGAPVAWHAALLRPDRFRAVIGLSVPFRSRGPVPPTTAMPRTDDAMFYQLYFQEPGVAEAELERDVRLSLRRLLYSASGDAPRGGAPSGNRDAVGMVPRRAGFLSGMADPRPLPPWLAEADIDFYAGEFARTGFRGGLNWYRNIDRNWELLAPFAGAHVTVPALYIAGDRDLVVAFRGMDQLIPNLSRFVPQLRKTIMLSGCGHWTQQERPKEINAAMTEFLKSL
jgi:pimeloyl-ACP methyl ester carboxylesterase